MTSTLRDRLRKVYAVLVIGGVLGAQAWVIVPRGVYANSWYWPFMNYPMYSAPHYAGERFSTYELWAGPADASVPLRIIPSHDLHLTPFKYSDLLREAIDRDRAVVWRGDESASEFVARLVTGLMPSRPIRLQIWQHTWTLGQNGVEDRDGTRELKREWTPSCEVGAAGTRCAGEVP